MIAAIPDEVVGSIFAILFLLIAAVLLLAFYEWLDGRDHDG